MIYALILWFLILPLNTLQIGKYYNVKGTLSCNSVNVVYLITCQCCKLKDIGSAITFKKDFAYIKVTKIQVQKDVVQLSIF